MATLPVPTPRPEAANLMVLRPQPGYTPQIGRLVAWMNYVRQSTLDSVRDLTIGQLDHLVDAQSNSVAMLLAHMAALENVFQWYTFENAPPPASFLTAWGAALNLGDRGRSEIKERPVSHYIKMLGEVRESTLSELARRDDDWFDRKGPWMGGAEANNAFKWFHVVEDEIHHRGQIRFILSRMRTAGSAGPTVV
jgi:uncharacterized damage-inducible protein DinB